MGNLNGQTEESINNGCLRLALFGDPGVGKSSLNLRFSTHTFGEPPTPEPGVLVQQTYTTFNTSSTNFNIEIWDMLVRREAFNFWTRQHLYKSPKAILLVYDVTSMESFAGLRGWLKEIDMFVKGALVVLVGNKCDLERERKVSTQEAFIFANHYNMLFFETSAKDSTNVEELFLKVVKLMANLEPPKLLHYTSECS